jgi:hypothetical protein
MMTAKPLTTPIRAAPASKAATAHETTARESGPVESSFVASTNNSLRIQLLSRRTLGHPKRLRDGFISCPSESSRCFYPSMDKEMFDGVFE